MKKQSGKTVKGHSNAATRTVLKDSAATALVSCLVNSSNMIE